MRFCCVECRDFPDSEFKHEHGVWYHCPEGGEEHLADDEAPPQPKYPGHLRPLIERVTVEVDEPGGGADQP